MYSHQSSKCMLTKAACFNFARCVFFTFSVLFISCDYFTVIGYKCLFVWSVDLCLLPIEYHFSTDLGNTIKIKTVKPFRKFIQDTSFDFWGPHAYIYIRYKLRMLFVCLYSVLRWCTSTITFCIWWICKRALSLSLILADESSSQVHLDACFSNPGAIFSMPLLLLLRMELNFSTNFPLLIRFNRTNNLRQYATHTWNYCQ